MPPNGRGVGITEMLHGAADWPVLVLFALLTQLGDAWFLFALGSVLYVTGDRRWLGIDRRRGLFVLGVALSYVVLIGVLKNAFMLPRPPGAGEPPPVGWVPPVLEPVLTSITTGDGSGFPSGHALGTTMVWGGVALVLDRGSSRLRLGLATGVVVLVSLSRLVLGVHYAVDVVAGVAVGGGVLVGLYRLADGGTAPGRVFLLAVVVGSVGLFVGTTLDSVMALGGAVGGWFGWRAVAERTPVHPSDRRAAIVAVVVGGAAGAFFGAVYALTPSLGVGFLGAVVAAVGVVAAPAVGERLVDLTPRRSPG